MKRAHGKCGSFAGDGVRCVTAVLLIAATSAAVAGPREQAKRIHDRLVGVPPTEAVLSVMAAKVAAGDAVGAAYDAMTNAAFYNTTLKNFVTPWTNEAQTPYAPLNDYTATVIGMVRDDVPFNQALTEDIVYIGASAAVTTAYSQTNNDHYVQIESNRVDMSKPANLVRTAQSSLPGAVLTTEQTAGVMTTRAFAEAFLKMGTNRRAIRYAFMTHLCRDMEDVHDVTRTPDRVRQDVSRSPGGDSSIYLNQCVGCHAGMDPLTQAFAYYDFAEVTADAGEQIVITPGAVQEKNLINANNFPAGYVVANDRWDNYWRQGPNAALGWSASQPSGGNGVKSLGRELASSKAFAQCQVQKVFKFTCLRDPASAADQDAVRRITGVFEENASFSMKRVFAETAAYCKGE
jgi:hypothetical protein